MNLFWDMRKLTQLREDHLTCFVAGALQTDPAFRTEIEIRLFSHVKQFLDSLNEVA